MLGAGVYTISEVSRLTQVPVATVRSWFTWRSDRRGRGPVFASDYESRGRHHAVSFLDLIDAFVASEFKREGVPLKIVRRAYQVLKMQLDTSHPFAHEALRESVYTDGRGVIRKTADSLGEPSFTDVVSRQMFFADMVALLKQIDYHSDTQLARRWRIAQGVVVDPSVSYGKPTIASGGTTTFVLRNQFFANNENAALVADLFGVSEMDVINAVQFEEGHGRRTAA